MAVLDERQSMVNEFDGAFRIFLGAIGFDGGIDFIAACRGPQAHVKTRGTHNCEH